MMTEAELKLDIHTQEAIVLAEELSQEAQDTDQGALVEAVLSVDSEL